MRLPKEIPLQMKGMYQQGKTLQEIAKHLDVSVATVNYHVNDEVKAKKIKTNIEKFRNKTFKERQKAYQRRKEYIKNYCRKRYHEDETFREKQKERARLYQRQKGSKKHGSRHLNS